LFAIDNRLSPAWTVYTDADTCRALHTTFAALQLGGSTTKSCSATIYGLLCVAGAAFFSFNFSSIVSSDAVYTSRPAHVFICLDTQHISMSPQPPANVLQSVAQSTTQKTDIYDSYQPH
jgi:hypothetical protein